MAITFTSVRNFATANTAHMFYSVPLASQCFKIRVDSAVPPVSGTVNVVSRNIFDFIHAFWATSTRTATFNLQLNGAAGAVQTTVTITIGSVYVICLVWNGTAKVQTCYVNGVPQIMGHIAGLTTSRVDPIQIGPLAAETALVYTLGDYNAWDNYGLTSADAAALTNNGDPATIGTSASWRCHWTLAGPTGTTAAVGDNGLKNAYGTGADFTTATGSGHAVYADPLVWSPTVTAHPYVTGCGKSIGSTFALNIDGSAAVPSQLLSTPTIKVNGTALGPLENAWLTGVHQCVLWSTPGKAMIHPGDVVELTAPTAWANTPAGPVAALSGAIDNRSGGSSVGADTLTKTLRMGFNLPIPSSFDYYPFRNAKYQLFLPAAPGHGYGPVVDQPCEAGLVLLVWDAVKPLTPAILGLQSNNPTRVTVTHHPEYDVSPPDGVGYVRVYEIAYITSSDYESVQGGSGVGVNIDDPAFTGTRNYTNHWIYLAGEWDVVDGAAVFDRSDPLALSRFFLDNVTENIGSLRFDSAGTGACYSFPYPELMPSISTEFWWGFNPVTLPNVGFTSLGPVDPAVTPWIYDAKFKQDANKFTATLADTISTVPAVGTNETHTFSDAATAPLMAGLEIQIDAEIMRILSVSGTSVTLYRGSNGTAPATHSPGTVTVFGRVPISTKVKSDGTAGFTAPALLTCNGPHGLHTFENYYPTPTGSITMADGTVEATFGFSSCHVTGPDTFVSIWSGYYPTKPNGTKPASTSRLNPATNYFQRQFFAQFPLAVQCDLSARLPLVKMHVNVPLDACDDMVYLYARTCRDNYPAGRKIYVEYANEPWNFSPPFQANGYCSLFGTMAMPSSLNTFPPLSYYVYRATQVHRIFREVFAAVGRSDDLLCAVNCQMASGPGQVTPELNMALALGQPLDAVMIAPYYSLGMSGNGLAATVAAFNASDDDQAAEMVLHDITYDTTGMPGWIKSVTDAVQAYNRAHGKSCVVIGYEGSLEYAAPAGAAQRDTRNHDIQYNPNYYQVEQGYYKVLQDGGLQNMHVMGLGIGWPYAWGLYHMRTQKHSRGDGLGGAYDNRTATITPGTPGYIGGSVTRQDRRVDSVRGQAFIDWVDAVSGLLSGTAGLRLFDDVVAAAGVINVVTQAAVGLDLSGDTVAAVSRPLRTTKAAPYNATMDGGH